MKSKTTILVILMLLSVAILATTASAKPSDDPVGIVYKPYTYPSEPLYEEGPSEDDEGIVYGPIS